MSFTVEIRLAGTGLAGLMERSRTWLDHRQCEPDGFREVRAGSYILFRVDFRGEQDASEFAQAFDGRVLGIPQYLEGRSTPVEASNPDVLLGDQDLALKVS